MTTVVVSDIHLGSRHCRVESFGRFLDRLPPEVPLVMNGDVVDGTRRRLPAAHAVVLERLADESRRRPVVWVQGNHDDAFRPDHPAAIQFVPSYAVGRALYIQHGFYFDHVMPYHLLFIFAFRMMHRLRILMGAEPVHVAQYAKRWSVLYAVLRRNVRENALRYAREQGFGAVTCGHTHFAEVRSEQGVVYLNTGAWTEAPAYAVVVEGDQARLHRIDDATGALTPTPLPAPYPPDG